MKSLKRILVTLLVVITLSVSFIGFGNLVGDNTPVASAVLTGDEAELCLLLNRDIYTDEVDVAGLLECIAHMNND